MKAQIIAKIVTPIIEGATTNNTTFKKFAVQIKKGGVATEGKSSTFGVLVFGKNSEIGFRTGDMVSVDGSLQVGDFQITESKAAVKTAIISARHIEVVDGSRRMFAKAYNVLGNAVRDAELKTFNTVTVSKTALACNRKEGQNKVTDFVDIALFGKQAESLNSYITKGKKILVDGALSATYYEKKQGGKGLDISISVDDFQFAGGGQSDSSNNNGTSQNQNAHTPDKSYAPDNTHTPDITPDMGLDEDEEFPF